MTSVLITGATGMVGSRVLELALADSATDRVYTYGRRATGLKHPKLTEFISEDFIAFPAALTAALSTVDTVLFCLGVYTGAVPAADFRRITVDYPVELARVLKKANPSARFVLLSGAGADRSEKSRMMFARDKGAAENQLEGLFPGAFVALRPGYIYPVLPRREPNFFYRLYRWLYPVMRPLVQGSSITSFELADGLYHFAQPGAVIEKSALENAEIRQLTQ